MNEFLAAVTVISLVLSVILCLAQPSIKRWYEKKLAEKEAEAQAEKEFFEYIARTFYE